MRGPRDSARTLEVMVVDQRISSLLEKFIRVRKTQFCGSLREAVEEAHSQVVRSGVHFHAEDFVCRW